MFHLLLGIALFVPSILVLVQPPAQWAWPVRLAVTEWGWWLVAAALVVLLVPGWWRRWTGRVGAGLALGALVIAAQPILQARDVAEGVPARLVAAFGDDAAGEGPVFRVGRMVRGGEAPEVEVSERSYGPPGRRLPLHVYRSPGQRRDAPAVIVIHGGSWRAGDPGQVDALSRRIASWGYVVLAPAYRFADEAGFPAPVQDIGAVVEFLRRGASGLRWNGREIALVGRSAGGQVALVAAYDDPPPEVRGAAAFYAPTDLTWGWENPGDPDVLDGRAVLEAYLGGTPAERPRVYAAASPTELVTRITVPTLLVHGDMDAMVHPGHAERLAGRLAVARRPHAVVRLPWGAHGCDVNVDGPCGQIALYALERFLRVVLGPGVT